MLLRQSHVFLSAILLSANILPTAAAITLLHTPTATPSPQQTTSPPNPNIDKAIPSSPSNTTLHSLPLLRQRGSSSTSGWSPAIALQNPSGVCPQWAYINCQSITEESNYCCGEGTYCAYGGEDNHIGCCADSEVCDGTPPGVGTTVYVPTATGTTWWTQSGTTVTELIGPAYTVTTTTTATQYLGGGGAEPTTICSTMYAHGDNLPATAAAECGYVLVLNGAGRVGGGGGGGGGGAVLGRALGVGVGVLGLGLVA